MPNRNDTIVATSTAPGRGAIAIVRLSGRDAFHIASAVSKPFPDTARLATLCHLHRPHDPAAVIDQGLVTRFDGPASYTGDDLVELAVHGGTLVSTLVVEALVQAGARPAFAGEFTERAVLNGKMDLVQAEAVADIIDARSRAAHRAAVRQLDGALSQRLSGIRQALLQVDALIAYEIDFPMEDDGTLNRASVTAACDDALARIEQLLATLPAATLGREGAIVVLAGPPNAGKSALLNAVIGESRVLVSEIPGTTRDAVEVFLDDDPYPLCLVDTAGLRTSADRLEQMGIEVSERYLAKAQVVLACAESPDALDTTMRAVQGLTQGTVVPVATKCDLTASSPRSRGEGTSAGEPLRVSAVTGEGLPQLRDAIRRAVADQVAPPAEDVPLITRARHEHALRRAAEELRAFSFAWESRALPAPVAATHLRAAATALESLIGAVDVEDVLERVFRTFCIGK